MHLDEVLRGLSEKEQKPFVMSMYAECVQSFPVLLHLPQHVHPKVDYAELYNLVNIPANLLISAVALMNRLDVGVPDDVKCSILQNISPNDLEELPKYIAVHANLWLRVKLPVLLRRLDADGLLHDKKSEAIQLAKNLFEDFDENSSRHIDCNWWREILTTLQITRFAKRGDLELWDFAIALTDLDIDVRSASGHSWCFETIAKRMNNRIAIPLPIEKNQETLWTPEMLVTIEARFQTFCDRFRTNFQLKELNRKRELRRREQSTDFGNLRAKLS